MIAEIIATLCSALFAGAAFYVSLVEHPARMKCGVRVALTEFGPSYKRGTVMQASLAIGGFVSAVIAWITQSDSSWLIGGAFLLAVVPFTILVILPTNKKLLDPATIDDLDLAKKLLIRWGRLHVVRSILSLISTLMFLLLLATL
jgi:uncharacterized membrane protein